MRADPHGDSSNSDVPWLGNWSTSQPVIDDSWRDTPTIEDQLFKALFAGIKQFSLRRKIVGIALIALISVVILWVFTVVFLVNM